MWLWRRPWSYYKWFSLVKRYQWLIIKSKLKNSFSSKMNSSKLSLTISILSMKTWISMLSSKNTLTTYSSLFLPLTSNKISRKLISNKYLRTLPKTSLTQFLTKMTLFNIKLNLWVLSLVALVHCNSSSFTHPELIVIHLR